MKFLLILFAITLFSIAETQSEDVSKDDWSRPAVDIFDCSKQEDGKYQNPKGCSSYIECKNKKAIEIDCDECSNRSDCPEGRLHYNRNLGICESAERANCKPPPTPPSTLPTTPGTPSTPRTTPIRTTPVTSPRTTTPRPVDQCPRNCSQKGYCEAFQHCDEPEGGWVWDDDSQMYWGKWQTKKCGENLLWNPTPGVAPGGHCDFFKNLPLHIQIEYKKDPECFCPCYWDIADTKQDRCDGKYLYWNRDDEDVHDLVATEMQCPKYKSTQLLFNNGTKTCDYCTNLQPHEKTECSC